MKTLQEVFRFVMLESGEEVFSFSELRKYVQRPQRESYLNSTLKVLGQGSSRVVFELSANEVLKMAMTDQGQVQNETEYRLYHTTRVKEVLAAVKEPHDPDFEWIVMEKVRVFQSEQEFRNALGMGQAETKELFGNLCYTVKSADELKQQIQSNIDYLIKLQKRQPRNQPHPQLAKWQNMIKFTDQFAKICLAVPELESNGGDLGRLDQLGFNKKGEVVIADYGFGKEAYAMYNPAPYQLANQQAKEYQDIDDREEFEPEYDKYGNKLIQSHKPNSTPSAVVKSTSKDDEDIPF